MSSIQDISDELNNKLNEIRMSKNHPLVKNKVFILLEGKTDIKLFRNFFNHATTYIEEINGKEKVIKALAILQEEGFVKIFGIKDADFDNLENITYEHINLFVTDYADMEIHMIESSAFTALINEYSSQDCYESFLEYLKDDLYKKAILIGYLRWHNEKYFKENNSYLFNFKGLNFNNFVDISKCEISIDKEKLFMEIKQKSNLELNNDEINEIIYSLKSESNESTQICNGHDITTLLAYLFNHKDNSDKTNLNNKKIEEALRLAYNFDNFKQTHLYNALQTWENTFNIQILKT